MLLAGPTRADTFQLNDGQILVGEAVSPDERGVRIRLAEGGYAEVKLPDGSATQTVPWTKFSQADLKKIAATNPKTAAFVEPFIEVPPDEKAKEKKKREITVKPVPRLERPPAGSLLGALFSSSVGLAILFILYLANIYAGYEVAIIRAQPAALVCGLAAVVPIIGPVIFLCLPTRVKFAEAETTWASAEPPAAAAPAEQVPGQPATGLALAAHDEPEAPAIPLAKTFARGEFTFNRRFFETKFPGFFGIIRRDTERDLVLSIKSARGLYVAQRISRIAANEMHIQVQKGHVSEEVIIPFVEIEEVQLKHKSAP